MTTESLLYDYVNVYNKLEKNTKIHNEKLGEIKKYFNLKCISDHASIFVIPFLFNIVALFIAFISTSTLPAFVSYLMLGIFSFSLFVYVKAEIKKQSSLEKIGFYFDNDAVFVLLFLMTIIPIVAIYVKPEFAFYPVILSHLFICLIFFYLKVNADDTIKRDFKNLTKDEKDGSFIIKIKDENKQLTQHFNFLLHKIVEDEKTLNIVLNTMKNPSAEYTNEYPAYKKITVKLKQLEKNIKKREKEFTELKSLSKSLFDQKNAQKKKVELVNK